MSTMARAHGRRYRPCDGDPRRVGAVAKRLEGLTETSTAGPSTRPRLWRAAPALARAAGQRLRTIEQVAAKATKRSARACYGCPLSTVRPAKDRSPLAAVPLGRTRPAEPVPAASVSAEAIPVEHEEDAAPRAAPAYAAPSAAASQPSAKAKKHQRIARTQTRRRNGEDDNHDQRASYWTGRGSIDAQHRRGGYRAWAYGGPRSWGWF